MTRPEPPVVAVVLKDLPLDLARRTDEHHADLLRELALLSLDGGEAADVPGRLLALVDELQVPYAEASAVAEVTRDDATARGEAAVDLVMSLPASVGPSAARLLGLLEEADAHCRRGARLLTTAPDEDVAAFRRWYFGQVAAQAAGEPPVPWRAPER